MARPPRMTPADDVDHEPAEDSPDETDVPEQYTDEDENDEEKPKPSSSGESHQPRTDAEIGEGGSLFDL